MRTYYILLYLLTFFFTVIPILTLKLGSNLDPDNIREGGDVYLECIIHANPWVYKVVWEHNVSYKVIRLYIIYCNLLLLLAVMKFLQSYFK